VENGGKLKKLLNRFERRPHLRFNAFTHSRLNAVPLSFEVIKA